MMINLLKMPKVTLLVLVFDSLLVVDVIGCGGGKLLNENLCLDADFVM